MDPPRRGQGGKRKLTEPAREFSKVFRLPSLEGLPKRGKHGNRRGLAHQNLNVPGFDWLKETVPDTSPSQSQKSAKGGVSLAKDRCTDLLKWKKEQHL